MTRSTRSSDLLFATFCVLVVSSTSFQATLMAADHVTVIATGLANPRGIAFAPNGDLYVTEAGSGGNGACVILGSGLVNCYGESGALTRIDPTGAHAPERVASGLPSLAPVGGFGATGPHDVAFLGNGNAQLLFGLGTAASQRDGVGALADLFGTVAQFSAGGNWKAGPDFAAFEEAVNPVPGGDDSNPYGVAALPSRQIVVDAGANALLEAHANGQITLLAVFETIQVPAPAFLGLPPGTTIPMQAVPTCAAEGPDGWIYVGQLTGFPFPIGASKVRRVPPAGGAPEVVASGFTNVVDLSFDGDGNLYVLEIAHGLGGSPLPLSPPGTLWRVAPDDSRVAVATGLFFPAGVAIGPDGAAYVTEFGISPTDGRVLRIALD